MYNRRVDATNQTYLSEVVKIVYLYGLVCLVAMAADCKSVTKKHRRFNSYPAQSD